MFQDTGVLHGYVEGAVVAVAGCEAGRCAKMAQGALVGCALKCVSCLAWSRR